MEPNINTCNEFLQRYWNYYLLLEKDFLDVEQYLAIDEVNFDAFSNEYIKQYQTICSEIDVVSKSFCKILDNGFGGDNIDTYCKCIIDNQPDFSSRIIKVSNKEMEITPWKDWSYSEAAQANGRIKVSANNPDWWKKYNKIKHNRTTINSETGMPYYKLANQKNVLNALAALFQIEMYYYKLLHQRMFGNEPDMPIPQSNVFHIEGWGNRSIVLGPNIWIEPDEE